MRGCAVTAAVIAATGIVCPRSALAQERPTMSADRPIHCAKDKDGHVWRVQCDPATKVCLYAPNEELDSDGGRTGKPLERVEDCPAFDELDRGKLEADGFTLAAGRPDAPWGWMRDDRGRVFQVNFDLKRRMYLGFAYTPEKVLDNPLESTRTSMNFGLFVYEDQDGVNRHRIRLVEGEVHLQPFSAELTLVHYELSRHFIDPLLRITTFVGEPQRHDLHLNLGLWTEGGRVEVHRTSEGDSSLWKFGAAAVTLDLWQSAKLDSYARLRTGIGIERQFTDIAGNRSAITPSEAFEIDTVLDREGFHNLHFEIVHEMPQYILPLPNGARRANRMRARLQYEAVVLAINDQPISLTLAAGSDKRNDLPGVRDQWAFVMDAGLRYSLWAPPRPR
jgi:hypothetical protein